MWKCIESVSYYEKKKIKTPTCFEEKGNRWDDVKDNNDNPSLRQLGEACLNDLSCISGNCSPTCDVPESESLCYVPRWLLIVNSLPLPRCIDKNGLPALTHLSKSNGTSSSYIRYLVPVVADQNSIKITNILDTYRQKMRFPCPKT